MVEKTVNPPVDRAAYEGRAACVVAAAYEIELIVGMLQKYIENTDDGGEIFPVTRGAFMRVADLAGAMCSAVVDDGPTSPNELDRARQVVYGEEVSHV